MPSASIINQSNTKLVKQTSVNSINSGGAGGTSGVKGKKPESTTKSNSTSTTIITINNETSSIKTAKENSNNLVVTAAGAQQQNNKNWETSSAGGNTTTAATNNKDAGNDALNPMKLTLTTIEHKIRNLEKRKTKLEGYLCSGKELSADQRAAVAKYDAVMATLEFARDLVKQMQQFTKDAEKEQKKQARKELIAKAQSETIKIREVLIIQNILSCLHEASVRTAFLEGENGAAKLETNEMEILEKFCCDVETRRPEAAGDVPFATTAQKVAEILSMTIDARPKQYGETTYENVKRIFHRIQESNYLDKIYLTDVNESEIKTSNDDIAHETVAQNEDDSNEELLNADEEQVDVEENMEKLNDESDNMVRAVHENPVVDSVLLLSQQPQPVIIKEHIDLQQQQVALANIQQQSVQPLIATPMAPPATAVPSFRTHSGAATPVHVALYHPSLQQPAPQQLQQLPNGTTLIAGVHTNVPGQILSGLTGQPQGGIQNVPPPSSVQTNQQQQQQRQMLQTSPGTQGVGSGPIVMHNSNPQQQPPPPGHFNPTPVHAVEQNFFKHQSQHTQQPPHQQQHQYLQQIRPLAEVIGSGNFYFLQDSELDSPEVNNQGVQGVPQNTIVFEQQQPPLENMQQNKNTQNLMTERSASSPSQQQQLHHLNNHHPLTPPQQLHNPAQTPIQSQTFTNQSFPQMPPPPPQQQQHPPNAALMQSNTPSPLFQQSQQQQTHQQQQKASNTNNQQLFSPVPSQTMPAPPHQPQQQQSQLMLSTSDVQQQPPPNILMMNRLAASAPPKNPLIQQQSILLPQQQPQQINTPSQNLVGGIQPLPPNKAGVDITHTTKNAGFPFENSVVAGLTYEEQMQNKVNAEKVLTAFQEVNNVSANHLHKNDLINEWDEAVLKSNNSPSANNQQDYKTSALVQAVEPSTKWSAEATANSPITVQQSSSRKTEWTSSSANTNNNTPAAESTGGAYNNDNRSETNHWHSQDANNYGRGSSGGNRGQGGSANAGGYQRQRNDDRRDDRRPGGGNGGGGGYRGRSNYGSGNPQQNGQSRGGAGGNSSSIYFRNNENSNNSYYQNGNGGGGGGNVYSNKDSRYDSRGNTGGNYRGPRGSDNSANPRSNGPPPRHMGNRTGGSGNANNANSNSYMNSRQSNRIPLGIENKN